MNIKKELLKEYSKKQTTKIVNYVGNSPARFKVLVQTFLAGPYRVTQRAAWPLSYCVREHPKLVNPHLKSILKMLDRKDAHVAVKRNIMRLLQDIEIPKQLYGTLIDRCFASMDPKETIAVRVFSMSVLANIAMHEPDLKKELKIIIEDQLPYASAGFLSRARKVLKQLSVNS
ncbi:MAG TPA: hypothetical protein VFU05_18565 [Cyclobacteriaceae bacterium]|nr:hypothetical protein [Cyclobacteriaceae bacterium]